MSIDKYNLEGYYDPDTYQALTKIEKEERVARKSEEIERAVKMRKKIRYFTEELQEVSQ